MPGPGLTFAQILAKIRDDGLENVLDRWYSTYPATVVDDADENQQGKSQVHVEVLGFPDPHPRFSYPVSPYAGENYGFYFPPHKDSAVFVSFDHGNTNSARVVGSWWQNPDDARRPGTSHVPAEFVKSDGSAPTARGIKTKGGHGLIFEDDADQPHVELWSGENRTAGTPANKHHRVRLDDTLGEEEIVIASFGGHKSTWRDKAGDVFYETTTTDGHQLLMSDTDQHILVKTTNGYQILLDDAGQAITASTAGNHNFEMSDASRKVSITTAGQHQFALDDTAQEILAQTTGMQTIRMSDLTQSLTVSAKPGQSIVQGIAGTTLLEPAATTVLSGGPLALTGAGVAIQSTGGGASSMVTGGAMTTNFAGAKTDQIGGAWTVNVAGLLSFIVVGAVNIASSIISLGNGPTFFLVDSRFLDIYNNHTHPVTPAVTLAPSQPAIIGLHTTLQTTAA